MYCQGWYRSSVYVCRTSRERTQINEKLKNQLWGSFRNASAGENETGWENVRRYLRLASFEVAAAPTVPFPLIPLHMVCSKRPPADVVESLLSLGSDVRVWEDHWYNKPNWFGKCSQPPLHVALKNGASSEVVQLLLDYEEKLYGAKYDVLGSALRQAFNLAPGASPSLEVVQLLLDRCEGEELVHFTDGRGRTALHIACRASSSPDAMRLLLDRDGGKELVHFTNFIGQTALHMAVECGSSEEVMHILLDAGGEGLVQRLDNFGRTALYLALIHGAPEGVVRLLLARGGDEVAGIAAGTSNGGVHYVMHRRGDLRGGRGRTPLEQACRKGASAEVVWLLLDRTKVDDLIPFKTFQILQARGKGASPEVIRLMKIISDLLRGRLSHKQAADFLWECYVRRCKGCFLAVLDKYPETIHSLGLDNSAMSGLLFWIVQHGRLQTVWEVLKGNPAIFEGAGAGN